VKPDIFAFYAVRATFVNLYCHKLTPVSTIVSVLNAALAPGQQTNRKAGGRDAEPKFEIFKAKDGQFWFRLQAGSGEKILKSEAYTTKQNCKNGIQSVKTNSPLDDRYKRLVAKSGEPYFNLVAVTVRLSEPARRILRPGDGKGIEAVKHDAPAAPIEDLA